MEGVDIILVLANIVAIVGLVGKFVAQHVR